jgi:hypothetical protein
MASVFVIAGGAHLRKAIRRKARDPIDAPERLMRRIDGLGGLTGRGLVMRIIAMPY